MRLSECKEQKELTFKFIIHSLQDGNNNNLYYYRPIMFKQETSLNWIVDIAKFQNCSQLQRFNATAVNNWMYECRPKGFDDELSDGFSVGIFSMSTPTEISRMIVTIKFKIMINSEVHSEKEWEQDEQNFNDSRISLHLFDDESIDLEKVDDMSFDATIIMKKLYDMDSVEIPIERWANHHVQIS